MLSHEYEIITEAQTLKGQLILMKKIPMINARDTPFTHLNPHPPCVSTFD